MKLRNKKTGEIGYIEYNQRVSDPVTGEDFLTVRYRDNSGITCYKDYATIKFFNTQWEDYKPAEPLIKDEKIRKVVRAWAEASGIETTGIKVLRGIIYTTIIGWKGNRQLLMEFENSMLEELKDGEDYTITELCGEEEE